MARAKTKADERYNERRRAKRAAERLEKQAKIQSGKTLAETKKQIANLREAINESYYDKKSKEYKQTIQKLNLKTKQGREYEQKIKTQNRKLSFSENARINKMQEAYFKSAAKGEEGDTPEKKLIRQEVSHFYSATRVLWVGGNPELKNENIVAGLRGVRLESGRMVENLADAVQWVKEQEGDNFPTIEKILNADFDLTEEEYEEISPPPFSREELRAAGATL